MRSTLISFGILLIFITLKFSCNNSVEFKFTNVVCETYNKSWFLIHHCRLKAINRNKTVFNFNGTCLQPARRIDVHFEILKRANGYKPWLFNETIDICRFLRRPYNPMAIIIKKLFIEFSNFNHTCPYLGSQIVSGFYLRPEILRLPFPTGEYFMPITWSFDKRPQFATNMYFKFVEDLINL